MRAIERIIQMLAASARHEAYAGSLSVGSPVAIAELRVHVKTDHVVEAVSAGGIFVDDGRTYTDRGHCDEKFGVCRFIVEPVELSREQALSKLMVKELQGFPWKALTVEQLDAALKYARSKYQNSPKAGTKEKMERAA